MAAVAMANYARVPGTIPRYDHDCNGHSAAFSGICAAADGEPLDPTVLLVGYDEQVQVAPFDITALRAYRRCGVWGDAYRKPYAYRRSTAPDWSDDLFRRADARCYGA
jgi:hypothetical protein